MKDTEVDSLVGWGDSAWRECSWLVRVWTAHPEESVEAGLQVDAPAGVSTAAPSPSLWPRPLWALRGNTLAFTVHASYVRGTGSHIPR